MNITKEQTLSLVQLRHLSFTAVKDFIECRRKFKTKWIDHIFDQTRSVPLTQGSAYHAGLKAYWQTRMTNPETPTAELVKIAVEEMKVQLHRDAETTEYGLERIAQKDIEYYQSLGCEIVDGVDKGGKRLVKVVQNAELLERQTADLLAMYAANPTDYVPVAVEIAHTAITKDAETGEDQLVPLKGRLDLLSLKDGTLKIVDHKLNSGDPEIDEETGEFVVTPAMRLQGAAYESMIADLAAALKIKYEKVEIEFEVINKKNGNKTLVPFVIEDADRIAWSRLYRSVIKNIALVSALDDWEDGFIPNPFAAYPDGWKEFMADIKGETKPRQPAAANAGEAYEL